MDLITGAGGFLGRHLVERLLPEGRRLRLTFRKPPAELPYPSERVEAVAADVTRPETLAAAMAGVERVVHVAGHIDFNASDMDRLLAVNEQGTRHVMDAARDAGVKRIVHVSSVSTIGGTRDPQRLMTEEDFGTGTGLDLPYPQSKYRGEKVALEAAERGQDVVIVNPTFFCGPGDDNLGSARTLVSFLRGQVLFGMTRGGLGYTDVRDVAAGTLAALRRGRSGERYILGGTNLLLAEYHAILQDLTGVRAPRFRLPPWLLALGARPIRAYWQLRGIDYLVDVGDVRMGSQYWLYDYRKAQDELGLTVRPPRESLAETLDWLRRRQLT